MSHHQEAEIDPPVSFRSTHGPIQSLIEQSLFSSAATAASFQLSKTPKDAMLLYLFGRALMGTQEYARAGHAFRTAGELRREDRASFRRPFFEEDLQYHNALCYERAGKFEDALEVFGGDHSQFDQRRYQRPRTLLLLARLMRAFHPQVWRARVAACYVRALELTQGAAVEAAFGLAEVDWSVADILALQPAIAAALERWPWLLPTLEAASWFRQFRFARALECYGQLAAAYPDNPLLLESLAECHLQMSNIEAGRRAFDQLRRVDPFSTQGLDLYAMLIERHSKPGQGLLDALARHILALRAPSSPQVWTALSVFWKSKAMKDGAMTMVENALLVCPSHARAHLLKGQLLLDQNKPEEAKESFRLAKLFHPSFQAYRGLVACKFKLNDPKGAMLYATELKQKMYDNARAITLYADLKLKFDTTKVAEAQALFAEALRIDPQCVEAIISMAVLHASQQRHDEATRFLAEKLGGTVSEADRGIIYFNLGKVYDSKGLFTEALVNYEEAQKALPGMKDIVDAIELLKSKLQRGNDQGSAADTQPDPDDDEEAEASNLEYEEETSAEGSYYV